MMIMCMSTAGFFLYMSTICSDVHNFVLMNLFPLLLMSQDRSDSGEHPSHNDDSPSHTDHEGGSQEDSWKMSRGETKWPTDVLTVEEVNNEGIPMDKTTHTRFKRVCGLTGRHRVSINLPYFNNLTKEQRE